MELAMRSSLQAYTKLKNTGFSEEQARAIVESLEEHSEVNFKDLATKADFADMKNSLGRLERDISWLTRLFMGGTLVILIGLAMNFLHH